MDRTKALKVSDDFVSALQSNRFDVALSLMEPEFIRTMDRTQAEGLARKTWNYCAFRDVVTLKRDEIGNYFYADGRINPMRKFVYGLPTTPSSPGDCVVYVEVVQENAGMMVVTFGTLKE
jgi:hypothetical protein